MDIEKAKDALSTLIVRLKDAEKGFQEIAFATSHLDIKSMCELYAVERHLMHKVLETHLEDLGGDAQLTSSFSGKVHRMWIDLKLSAWGDDFRSIVDEIERGSTVLIEEFQIVLDHVDLNSSLYLLLAQQQEQINLELNELRQYRERVNAATS